jgi:YVTN family beta-propeller protein
MARWVGRWCSAAVAVVAVFGATISTAYADKNAFAYVANSNANNVVVIDTNTNNIVATIPVASSPRAGAATPDGAKVYVASSFAVSVIDTSTNTITKTIALNSAASDLVIAPDGSKVYVALASPPLPTPSNPNPAPFAPLVMIDTNTDTINATYALDGNFIYSLTSAPNGSKLYLVKGDSSVAIFDTGTNTVVATVPAVKGASDIAITPDGTKLYVTGNSAFSIVSVIATNTNTIIGTIPVGSDPLGIAITPDGGKVYVTNAGGETGTTVSVITTSTDTVTATISGFSSPQDVAITPSGTLAYVTNKEADSVSVIDTSTNMIVKTITGLNFPLGFGAFMGPARDKLLGAAVLPSSRSVQVGSVATIFGTIINSGPGTANNCRIAPATAVPGTFAFQTTDAATNGLTGAANTPVAIPQGGAQSFLLAFTPSAAFGPTDVALNFSCSNAVAATSYSGINTLLLSASTTPVPDIVAIAATATNDGTLHVPGASGSGALAVAIANVGSGGSLIAQADTGPATLPLTLTLCQTNPATGACFSPPSASFPTTVNGNGTATYSIFATAKGTVPFSPAVNRLFIRFVDGGGLTRGSTSVAVRTQ